MAKRTLSRQYSVSAKVLFVGKMAEPSKSSNEFAPRMSSKFVYVRFPAPCAHSCLYRPNFGAHKGMPQTPPI